MNYQQLSEKLIDVGQLLSKTSTTLSGKGVADQASKVESALVKFEKFLSSANTLNSPDNEKLRLLLLNSEVTTAVDVGTLKKLSKKLLGKALTLKKGESTIDTLNRFVLGTADMGKTEEAIRSIQLLLDASKGEKVDLLGHDQLNSKLATLGAKSEEELNELLMDHYSDEEVRTRGRASSLKVTAKSGKKSWFRRLLNLSVVSMKIHRGIPKVSSNGERRPLAYWWADNDGLATEMFALSWRPCGSAEDR